MKKWTNKQALTAIHIIVVTLLISFGVLYLYTIKQSYKGDIRQQEYYNKVEALLDTICNQHDDYFHDSLMEQDVYYEYEIAKEELNK